MSSKGLVKRRYLQATAVKDIGVLLPNDNADAIKPDNGVTEMAWRTYAELEALLRSPSRSTLF
jgi:hypothetical protein